MNHAIYKKPVASKTRSSRMRRAALGVGLAVAIGATTLGGAKLIESRRVMERNRAGIERVMVQNKAVRDPKIWSKISMIYGWNPATSNGLQRIRFVEAVSRRTGVPPERVLLTIEKNVLDPYQTRALTWSNKGGKNDRIINVINTMNEIDPTLTKRIDDEVKTRRGSARQIQELSE